MKREKATFVDSSIILPDDLSEVVLKKAKRIGIPVSDYVRIVLWNHFGGLALS